MESNRARIKELVTQAKQTPDDQGALESIYAELKAVDPNFPSGTFLEFQADVQNSVAHEKQCREEEILAATRAHEAEGREFWRQVYIKSLRDGDDGSAQQSADDALLRFNATFPIQI